MKHGIKSYLLVFIQFGSLGMIAFSGSILPQKPLYLVLFILALILGLKAIADMHWGNFNIVPDVKPEGIFRTSGIYALIRHPMYLALLLGVCSWLLDNHSLLRIIFSIVFTLNMLLKIFYEERLLEQKFEGYKSYKNRSYRLIPYLF